MALYKFRIIIIIIIIIHRTLCGRVLRLAKSLENSAQIKASR